jgi:hypothetical protein
MARLGWLQRRKVLVDVDLQVGMSVNMLGWLYFYVVMFAVVVNAKGLWAIFSGSEADPEYFDAVQRLEWFTRFTVVPLVCMFVCVAIHGVVFAHRVAGPVQRFKSTLRDVAARRYPAKPVTLRPSDFLKDVAVEMSTVIASLRDDAERTRRMNQETVGAARELLVAIDEGRLGKPELLALAQAARDGAERCDRHLAEPTSAAVAPPQAAAAAETSAATAAA